MVRRNRVVGYGHGDVVNKVGERLIDFQPGDTIIKSGPTVRVRRYVVDNPVRTRFGKLRLKTESGTILTTWWDHPDTGYTLPNNYKLVTMSPGDRHPDLPAGVIPAPVDLSELEGNAISIVGAIAFALRRAGNDHSVISAFRREALSGDYDHVIQTAIVYTVDGNET